MNKIKIIFPKIKKLNLLLVASLVWFIAGINVINIGLKILAYKIEVLNIFLSSIVFILFFKFIFSKMVVKHTYRIMSYKSNKVEIYKFFDKKSYFIMIFMISFGIALRKLNVIQHQYLGSIYLGIGFALLSAAINFLFKYKLHFKSA